jgi:hypothetical protein
MFDNELTQWEELGWGETFSLSDDMMEVFARGRATLARALDAFIPFASSDSEDNRSRVSNTWMARPQ